MNSNSYPKDFIDNYSETENVNKDVSKNVEEFFRSYSSYGISKFRAVINLCLKLRKILRMPIYYSTELDDIFNYFIVINNIEYRVHFNIEYCILKKATVSIKFKNILQ